MGKEKILLIESYPAPGGNFSFLDYYDDPHSQSPLPVTLWKTNEKEESAQNELYNIIQQIVDYYSPIASEINKIWIISFHKTSTMNRLLKTSGLTNITDLQRDPKLLELIAKSKILDTNISPKELVTICNNKEVHLIRMFLGPKLLLLLSKFKSVKIFHQNSASNKILLKKPQRILEINKELQNIKIRIDECIHEGK